MEHKLITSVAAGLVSVEIAKAKIDDVCRDMVITLIPTTRAIDSLILQILPMDVAYADAVAADWMDLVVTAGFKPVSLSPAVLASSALGLSELTDGTRGFAHILLPPTRGVRLTGTMAVGSGTISGAIGRWNGSIV